MHNRCSDAADATTFNKLAMYLLFLRLQFAVIAVLQQTKCTFRLNNLFNE